MGKKAVSISIVLSVVSMAVLAMVPQTVNAQSAVRTLPASVAPSTNFDVDMIISSDFIGQLKETLSVGFSYVGSTLDPGSVSVAGQVVTFTIVLDTSFTYTVQSSGTPGMYAFSGYLLDLDLIQYTVTGDTEITICTGAPAVTADAGGPYTGVVNSSITFLASASGGSPPYLYEWDFDYDGIFTAHGEGESVSYTYGTAGEYVLALRVIDSASSEHIDITTVEISDAPSGYRSLPSSTYPGGNCTIILNISNYGTSGEIIERFPDGFFYIASSLNGSFPLENNSVRTILSGERIIIYYLEVVAPPGVYHFHGTLKDENGEEFIIKGDSTITVEEYPLTVDIDTHHRGQINHDIYFSPLIIGGFPPYAVQWDLNNDGVYETMGKNISYSWDETGNYTIGLKVGDDADATVTAALSVTVYEKQGIKNITWLLIVVFIICFVLILALFLKYRHR